MQRAINQYEYHKKMRNKTKTITLVKQRGGGGVSSTVYRITEQWSGESLPKYGGKQTREIPTGKREKTVYYASNMS